MQDDGAASRPEVQAEIESLRVQFLYNANRLGALEKDLLNATLANCRRSTQDHRQASQMTALTEKFNDAQSEIFLLQEKVKHTDLTVFRAQKTMTENYQALRVLETLVKGLTPAGHTLDNVARDVDNLVKQVLPDCHAYFQLGYRTSGIYTINPGTLVKTLRVFCVMVVDKVAHPPSNSSIPLQPTSDSVGSGGIRPVSPKDRVEDASTQPVDSVRTTTVSFSLVTPESTQGQAGKVDEYSTKKSLQENGEVRTKDVDSKKRGDIIPSKIEVDEKPTRPESQRSIKIRKRQRRRKRRREKEHRKIDAREKRNKKKRRKREVELMTAGKQRDQNTRRRETEPGRTLNKDRAAIQQPHNHHRINSNETSGGEYKTTHSNTIFDPEPTRPQSDAQYLPTQANTVTPTEAGGWTVIQRRRDGGTNFTQTWDQYASGFGSVQKGEDLWLGNEALHHLTKLEPMELCIRLEDVFGSIWVATYSRFRVAGRGDNYRIQLSGYHGNATDALSQCDGSTFSTVDRPGERGSRGEHCARHTGAGWWFPHCHVSCLNGPHPLGMLWFNNAWLDWVQIRSSTLMVRPTGDSLRWP
ncbi:hypothetical protein EGW08_005370 [Elysia chlorotica]|uniref:Fibrinogen C-terminal domain-containing protein n=1 Tax=Elysia chlorotica TaxID=188477 RepID=A0A3S1BM51_ELYCH|nr:hypothetical protein EGW08_005370 [Elysia chlorotica]